MAVVALLVIGPEKLPVVARTVGKYVGRFQRYVAQVKEEVGREVRFEELQKLQQEIKQGAEKVESSIRANTQKVAVKSVKKTTAKREVSKKPVAKKSVVKKPATKKATVKKATTKKPTSKKSIATKQTSKKVSAKKSTSKQSSAKA